MSQELQVGDVGTAIILIIQDQNGPVDISQATTRDIIFKNPVGKKIVKSNVAFKNDGTDGALVYFLQGDDLDKPGTWQIQAHVILPEWDGHSAISEFTVNKNI